MGIIENEAQQMSKSLQEEQMAQVGGNRRSNGDQLLDSFTNLGVYVVEESTRKLLYFNRRFREVCPNVRLGMPCRELMRGPCKNCPLDAMGEQATTHTMAYSESFAATVELTATRIVWEDTTPAIMVSVWPHYIDDVDNAPNSVTEKTSDYLTGAQTRVGFNRSMERLRANGADLTEYAVLFINVNGFKAVNELVGYTGGDNLLRTVYARMADSTLHPVIGARPESDHFVFLVKKSELVQDALPELLNFHWQYNGKDLYIHCHCGIYPIEDSTLEVPKMVSRAKLAKEHIVDEYVQPYAVFDKSMLEEYSELAEAFFFFDGGIKNNEFHVYYQPITDARTGKVASAEALVRRVRPDGTVISPGQFIPILERTGYISMLDKFVANEVRSFMYKRKEAGLPVVPISFNLSQKDLYDEPFMELLTSRIEASTLPKGTVLLEITEGAYTLNVAKHRDYLTRLRNAGAKILLDDFGTGYSSFGMFENFNFDRVKLDMSFVRQLSTHDTVRMVVECVIGMCHKMNVTVVAEGVETAEELQILREIGCDYIQGYYFSKPLNEQSFVDYLRVHL